jgi:hypothetical protein
MTLNYLLSEVFPTSSISDSVFIPNFLNESDALLTAQANHLVVTPFNSGVPGEDKRYDLYGQISKLIPIRDSLILVLLTDLRASLITYDDEFVTLSCANLTPSHDCPIPPLKYATHPLAVVLQLSHHELQTFPIQSNSITTPFSISIGCRSILDFVFIGPVRKVTRLAVLTSEYPEGVILRIIEIDSSESSYSELSAPNVSLPNDTYSIIALDPVNQSVVVAFSSQQAIRVLYNISLTPKVTTATISTPFPLMKMVALQPNFWVAIDHGLHLRIVKLEAQGTVHFIDVDVVPQPTALVAVSGNLAFVASKIEDSVFFQIDVTSKDQICSVFSKIRQTGEVRSFVWQNNQLLTICERAVIETDEMIPFRVDLKIEANGWLNFWAVELGSETVFVITNKEKTFVMKRIEIREFVEVFDTPFINEFPTIHFGRISGSRWVQILENMILIHSDNDLNEFPLNDIIFATNSDDYLVVCHNATKISLFNLENTFLITTEINADGVISAIALSESTIAISSISWINLYSYKGDLIRKIPINTICISLTFDFSNRIIAGTATGSILILADIITEIPYNKSHCGIIRFDNNTLLIKGKTPALLRGDILTRLKSCPIFSAVIIDNKIHILSSDGIYIGDFENSKYFSNSMTSDFPFLGFHFFQGMYFTARLFRSEKEIRFYQSKEMFTVQEPFHIIQMKETFQGITSEGNNLLICTKSKVSCFVLDRENIHKIGEKSFLSQIKGFGKFRCFFYLVFETQIEFFRIEIGLRQKFQFVAIFGIENYARILTFSMNNQILTIVGPSKVISTYSYKGFGQHFISLPTYQSLQDITAITILGDSIFYGTIQGNIYHIEINQKLIERPPEFQIRESFCIGGKVTSFTVSQKSEIFVGTEGGMIVKIMPLTTTRRFCDFYGILATKVTSIGRLQKDLERLTHLGKYYNTKREICDIAVIREFLQMSDFEREVILEDSEFTIEEALILLKDFEGI